ncbi:MAG: hypothetical protein V1767_00570 [Chloroflexota bacterium]
MPRFDWYILMGTGGFFIFLGILSLIWGRSEEKRWYNSMSTRFDVREFMEHSPFRPEPKALKIGGWLFIVVGLALLIMGSVYLINS